MPTMVNDISITYGPHRLFLPLSGVTGREARLAVSDILNIGPRVEIYLNRKRVSPDRVVQGGDFLEFVRTFGRKGASTRPGGNSPHPRRRVPPGSPPWVTDDDIVETLAVWQRYSETPLTDEDALEILVNVHHLFGLLVRGSG